MESYPRNHYCFTLATLRTENGRKYLNSARKCEASEIPPYSIEVLRVNKKEATARVIATPKQLSIENQEILCILLTVAHLFMYPMIETDYHNSIPFCFERSEVGIHADFEFYTCYRAFLIYSSVDIFSTTQKRSN